MSDDNLKKILIGKVAAAQRREDTTRRRQHELLIRWKIGNHVLIEAIATRTIYEALLGHLTAYFGPP